MKRIIAVVDQSAKVQKNNGSFQGMPWDLISKTLLRLYFFSIFAR